MTEHDEHAAIGALVTRSAAIKRRRVALLAALDQARLVLERVAAGLKGLDGFNATASPVPTLGPDYPDRMTLDALLHELQTVNAEIERTRQLLKDAGLSP